MRNIPFLSLKETYLENRQALDEAYHRVMRSGRWILGPELEKFEAEFASYCGAQYSIGVGNGLDAIYLALLALDIGVGDEVIVPSHTFVATWLAVARTGAIPVPAEPNPFTYLVEAETVEACITPRTRAVIAVHLYGSVTGIEEIADLCTRRGISLIEDAAQAHGAKSTRARAGNHGVMGCFSFYPSKNLGAFGDGGAVITNDKVICHKLRSLRNYGGTSRYQHDYDGINSRLDEMQAAFLSVLLRTLDMRNQVRRETAERYIQSLQGIPELKLPQQGISESHVWHLFVISAERRDGLQKHLFNYGIEALIHYPKPVYRLTPFLQYAPSEITISDRLTAGILSLPFGSHIDDDKMLYICDKTRNFF